MAPPPPPASSSDVVRLGARLRMRKHRAAYRAEMEELKATFSNLQNELQSLVQQGNPHRRSRRHGPSFALAAQVMQEHNSSLRDEVGNQQRLVLLLHAWLQAQRPPKGLPRSTSTWMQTCLLADPAARRLGYQWLSNRVHHTATLSFPHHPCGSTMADAFQMTIHTDEGNDVASPHIAALEFQSQATVCANFQTVAHAFWNSVKVDVAKRAPADAVDAVHDSLLFVPRYASLLGSTKHSVCAIFESPTRIVVTSFSVLKDEKFPMAEGEYRTYGYGWTVFERVTNSITLIRDAELRFTPAGVSGPLPIEELGRSLNHPWNSDAVPREAYLAHLESTIEATVAPGYEASIRGFVHSMENSQPPEP